MDDGLRILALTTPQYAALAAIAELPGISGAALAKRCFVTPQTITGTSVIFLDSDPTTPLLGTPAVAGLVGGGTDNIAFLEGAQDGPNADAVRMSSIFWIETVAEQITVPALQPGESVTVAGADSAGDGLVPGFAVTATVVPPIAPPPTALP